MPSRKPKKEALTPPPTTTVEFTPMEVAAIRIYAEENHRSAFSMAHITHAHDPHWKELSDAWASIRRKLFGSDTLT